MISYSVSESVTNDNCVSTSCLSSDRAFAHERRRRFSLSQTEQSGRLTLGMERFPFSESARSPLRRHDFHRNAHRERHLYVDLDSAGHTGGGDQEDGHGGVLSGAAPAACPAAGLLQADHRPSELQNVGVTA